MVHTVRTPGGAVLWLTGLSGAGKSTIAAAVATRLARIPVPVELLDGDAVRALMPAGFSPEDRDAHVRRVAFLASRLEHHGITAVCSLISPYRASRDWARAICRRFVEIHVATPLTTCEARDVKGLYARARRGELLNFTGVSDPYETPRHADLSIDTRCLSVDEAADAVMNAWAIRVGVEQRVV